MPMTLARSWEELEIRTYAFLGVATVTAAAYYAPTAISVVGGLWLRNPARANEIANGVMEALSNAPTGIGTGIHIGTSDFAVIGPFKPLSGGRSYVEVAKKLKASYFNISKSEAKKLGAKLVDEANYKFLDWAAEQGKKIKLSTELKNIDPNSFTHEEIKYLRKKYGYIWNEDRNELIPPQ